MKEKEKQTLKKKKKSNSGILHPEEVSSGVLATRNYSYLMNLSHPMSLRSLGHLVEAMLEFRNYNIPLEILVILHQFNHP